MVMMPDNINLAVYPPGMMDLTLEMRMPVEEFKKVYRLAVKHLSQPVPEHGWNDEARKLLVEMDGYLNTNNLTSIGAGSIFHTQIKDLLDQQPTYPNTIPEKLSLDAQRYNLLRDECSWGEDKGNDWGDLGELTGNEFDNYIDGKLQNKAPRPPNFIEPARRDMESEPKEMTVDEFEATNPLMPLFVFAKHKDHWVDVVVGHRSGHYVYIFLGTINHTLTVEHISHISVPRKPP